MSTKHFIVTKETGISVSQITEYILNKNNLKNVSNQFRCRLEEIIMEDNNYGYHFRIGQQINAPSERNEIVNAINESIPFMAEGTSSTTSQAGWKLMENGDLVPGSGGWLLDEYGLYILRDGRRLSGEIVERDKLDDGFIVGKNNSREEGLTDILGKKYEGRTDVDLKVVDLFRTYRGTMSDIVYQAFQMNICKNQRLKGDTISTNVKFYSYGSDESGIPLVVTQIGSDHALHKIIISGPHGDERCVLRLIMKAQRYFSENPTPIFESDSTLYFIPAMNPTFYFADARGLPIVDENGQMIDEKYIEYSIQKCIDNIDISDLHEDIIRKISVPGKKEKVSMRTAIQEHNKNVINPDYPRYGIDTNRDYLLKLSSTRYFYNFVESLQGSKKTVILLHGYDSIDGDNSQGCVYPQYYVKESGENKRTAYPYPDRIEFSMIIRNALNWIKPQLNEGETKESYLYSDTKDDPDYYKGEVIRYFAELSPIENKVYAFDIELPHNYDEGKRGEDYTMHKYNEKIKSLNSFVPIFCNFLQNYYKLQEQENHGWKKG